jgi:hypothetical protein
LVNLTSIGGHLTITHNNSLTLCDIESICNYLNQPNGTITIEDNFPGCNSQAEVEAACLTGVEENIAKGAITLFPNPATSFITIHIKEVIAIEEAIIYNHLGQKALEAMPVNNTVDVSGLKAGIYILEVVTENRTIREKLMIE